MKDVKDVEKEFPIEFLTEQAQKLFFEGFTFALFVKKGDYLHAGKDSGYLALNEKDENLLSLGDTPREYAANRYAFFVIMGVILKQFIERLEDETKTVVQNYLQDKHLLNEIERLLHAAKNPSRGGDDDDEDDEDEDDEE